MAKTINQKYSFSTVKLIIFIILVLWSVIMLGALLWTFVSSLKDFRDFNSNMFGVPKRWAFDNYAKAFNNMYVTVARGTGSKRIYIEGMLFNSVVTVLGCGFLSSFIPFITAYVTSKYPHWMPSKIIYAIVIICMVLPIIGSLPSEIQMTMNLGLYNTLFVAPFLKSSFLGMYFLIFYGACSQISKGYTEAAYIDGANHYQVMFKIALPMVFNMFSIIFVLNCIGFWNDFNTPLMFMSGYPTMALGLYMFTLETNIILAAMPIKFAASIIMMLPVLCLFIIFRNKIIGRLSINGGIKG